MQHVGRRRVERAQQYYDKRALWNQTVKDFAKQSDEVILATAKFKQAVADLSAAELCAGRSSASQTGPCVKFRSEIWHGTLEEAADHELSEEPVLSRMEHIALLVDRVQRLQKDRDDALVTLEHYRSEVEKAQRHFDLEARKHCACNSNCSVLRAAPVFECRQQYEIAISAQIQRLTELESTSALHSSEASSSRSTSFFSACGGEISLSAFELPIELAEEADDGTRSSSSFDSCGDDA